MVSTVSRAIGCLSAVFAVSSLLGCLGASGEGVPSERLDSQQTPIVGGVPDAGKNPAVVSLLVPRGPAWSLCSSTLIGPRLILTARHCVSETAAEVTCPAPVGANHITADHDPTTLQVWSGDDIGAGKFVARGARIVVPKSKVLCDNDIALLVLDRDAVGIVPAEVDWGGVSVGGTINAVGYGLTSETLTTAGKKLRREGVSVTGTSQTEFVVTQALCFGDSGGPAINQLTGKVVGVASRVTSCDAPSARGIYTRVDAFSAQLRLALAGSTSDWRNNAGPVRTGE